MTLINFNNISKIYMQTEEINKLYFQNGLVWERRNGQPSIPPEQQLENNIRDYLKGIYSNRVC